MVRVQVIGHLCIDMAPELGATLPPVIPGGISPVGPIRLTPGGVVANCAAVFQRLGAKVTATGSVGRDLLGEMATSGLHKLGVDRVDTVVDPETPTSYSLVFQPQDADRGYWHFPGTNDQLHSAQIQVDPEADLVHAGYPSLLPRLTADGGAGFRDIFARARAQGAATSLDLAFLSAKSPLRALDWRDFFAQVLPLTDFFCPSWDDLASCLGVSATPDDDETFEMARHFLELGAGAVLLTMGERGMILATAPAARWEQLAQTHQLQVAEWADEFIYLPAERIENPVTTNGAGDTAKAAFLTAALAGEPPVEAALASRRLVSRFIRGELDT